MDDFPSPGKVKMWSWIATGAAVLVVLGSDFGPEPHVLSGIQNSIKNFKTWLFKPSTSELNELQTRYRMQLDADKIEAAARGRKRQEQQQQQDED